MPFPRKSHGTVKHIFKGLCFYFFKNSLEYECDFFFVFIKFFSNEIPAENRGFCKKKTFKSLEYF